MSSNMDQKEVTQFSQMGLDERLISAITKLKWLEPTPVQAVAIPYFLQGKDIMAKARTGSGKTGAYLVPLIQKLLEIKVNSLTQVTRALIVAPTKELCTQIFGVLKSLTGLFRREIIYVDLSPKDSGNTQKTLLLEKPDIVVGTPLKIMAHINNKNLSLEDLRYLVIDEADLIAAYEHSDDMVAILKHVPKTHQSFLTSATLGDNVNKLKKLALNKPKILKLEEPPLPTASQLQQYVIKLEEFDKVVLLQSFFQLNLLRGKTIIFVKTVDRAYKLRLFLEQFDIKSCVLNAAMPVASRCHIVDQFNSGVYSVIIASDEKPVEKSIDKIKVDKEAGVSRGINFTMVSTIVNFDFPTSVDEYIHRVGRTARGTNLGTALSLVCRREQRFLKKVEETLQEIMQCSGQVLNPFKYDLAQLDGFRYRAAEAWKRCTKIAVTDLRRKEIKKELLKSDQLRRHFEEKPNDYQVLRHDLNGKVLKTMEHFKHVPTYNIPEKLRPMAARTSKKQSRANRKKQKEEKRAKDPLRTTQFGKIMKSKNA